ncbi:hypothetical protein CLV56_2841 [Mumia flava]|uniref:TadE-like protein n=1 Tax=Mumia flava TaxID=1348852 RepID=A0A0B2BQU3_9ACTN|nr:hypothetical protein CLV56_2841 [Mumia flava]
MVETVWLGLVLLVPLVYVILAVAEVQSAAYGASAAARSAGRAYVLAPDVASAGERARAAARLSLADHGIVEATTDLTCTGGPCLSPGSSVDVTVTTSVDLPFIPDVLGGARGAVTVRGEHTVPYGRFREDRS